MTTPSPSVARSNDRVREIIDAARQHLAHLVGDWGQPGALEPIPFFRTGTALEVQLRTVMSEAFAALAAADKAVQKGILSAHHSYGQAQLIPEERVRLAGEVLAAAQGAAESHFATAEERLAKAVAVCEAAALPPRPTGDRAAQEAELGNLKADLRMLVDGLPEKEVAAALLDELRHRIAAGDDLAVWLLTGDSGWVDLYFRSRHLTEAALTWQHDVADVLAPAGTDDQHLARRVRSVVTGPKGLAGALTAQAYLVNDALQRAGAATESTRFIGGTASPAS